MKNIIITFSETIYIWTQQIYDVDKASTLLLNILKLFWTFIPDKYHTKVESIFKSHLLSSITTVQYYF